MVEPPMDVFARAAEDSYTTFATVKDWKEETGGRALGYFPVYFPEELAHALGFLPVGLFGASGRVSLDMATAHTQSFICSISRSQFQMVLQGNLDAFDALVFSNICDVARNLSGITKRNMDGKHIEYVHYPINNRSPHAERYLREEYARVSSGLERIAGRPLNAEKLRASIATYNEKRRLQEELVSLRRSKPWLLTYSEWYSLMRAGAILPVATYVRALRDRLAEIAGRKGEAKDRLRVAVMGNFCEQPPLMLMKIIEDAGCYIVHDEAVVGSYWMGEVRADDEDPLLTLARAYVRNPAPLTVRFHPDIDKQQYLTSLLESARLEGVIFCTPKFCEPALYDSMVYKMALEKTHTPYLHLEYEESGSSFEYARTMVETFVESILFD